MKGNCCVPQCPMIPKLRANFTEEHGIVTVFLFLFLPAFSKRKAFLRSSGVSLLARTRSNSYPRFFFPSFTICQTDCGMVTFRENTFVLEGRSFLFLPTGLCESRSRLFRFSLSEGKNIRSRDPSTR